MTDYLRRLLGLDGDRDGGKGDSDERSSEDDGPPREPELAPAGVPIAQGRTTVTGAALRVALVVVAVGLVLLVAYQLLELILVLLIALIMAAAMHEPASALERRGLPRPATIFVVYAGLLAVIGALVAAIAGPLVSEVQALVENAPEIFEDLRGQFTDLVDGVAGEGTGENIVQAVGGALSEVDVGGLVEIPLQAAGIVVNVIIILFLSAYLVLERDRAAGWFVPLLPPERRRPALRLGKAVFRRLGRFVLGQLLVMSVVGAAMFVGLVVLGVPFALPLALFAFVVEAIPMLGPWIAIIPALAVAFAESPTHALILAGWWFVVQQFEGYVLTPAVMGRVQHLSPTVVLLSVLGGFQLLGIVGALIAVPVVAAAAMVVEGVLRPARRRAAEGRVRPAEARRTQDRAVSAGR